MFEDAIVEAGHQSPRRQSSRRQTNSATRLGQLGDNLVRLSVCFVLIEQNKLSKKAVLSQGNHAMLLLISNMGYYLKQVAGHTYCSSIHRPTLTLTTSVGANTVGVFLFLTHRLECSVGRLSRTVNGSVGTLLHLNSPAQYLGYLDGPSGRCVAAPVRAAVHRITKFMTPLYHRCT